MPLVTDIAAGTGASTLFTAGTNGSQFGNIWFTPTAQTINGGGFLFVYFNLILAGVLQIPNSWTFADGSLRWVNPCPNGIIKASDTVKVGKLGQSAVIHAIADASDY